MVNALNVSSASQTLMLNTMLYLTFDLWPDLKLLARQGKGRPVAKDQGQTLQPWALTNRQTFPNILSRASEVGSPTNHLGSRQRRDTGQGSSSPLTDGLDLTPTVNLMINYQKLINMDRLLWTDYWSRFTKAGWAWHVTVLFPCFLKADGHLCGSVTGSWSCHLCIIEFYGGKKPEGME